MLVMLFRVFNQPGNSVSIGYSDFLSMVESESVMQVTIQGDNISGLTAQGPFNTFAPKDPKRIKLLKSKGAKISAKPEKGPSWSRVFLSWVLMLLLVGVWIFFSRRMQAAEEIMLNTQTTGAENDIEKASDLARKMVCEYGMSEELGPLTFGKKEEQVFLGREFTQHRDYSEMTAQKIDEEVRDIVIGAYKKAAQLIKDNLDTLHKMANALLEKETLNSSEIDVLMAGG